MHKLSAVAFAAMLLALPFPVHGVQAAETAILTLSCDGTATYTWSNATQSELPDKDKVPEPITKMGLVVNLTERTVTGLTTIARITNIDAATVSFEGQGVGKESNWSVHGSIDRITGIVDAMTMMLHPTIPGRIFLMQKWNLICKPAKRVF